MADRLNDTSHSDTSVKFQIKEESKLLAYFSNEIDELSGSVVTCMVERLISGICPSKKTRYPYSKGIAPPWWPHAMMGDYRKGPHHTSKDVVKHLLLYMMRLGWTVQDFERHNEGRRGAARLDVGWLTFIERCISWDTIPAIQDNRRSCAQERIYHRLLCVLKAEEEFLEGRSDGTMELAVKHGGYLSLPKVIIDYPQYFRRPNAGGHSANACIAFPPVHSESPTSISDPLPDADFSNHSGDEIPGLEIDGSTSDSHLSPQRMTTPVTPDTMNECPEIKEEETKSLSPVGHQFSNAYSVFGGADLASFQQLDFGVDHASSQLDSLGNLQGQQSMAQTQQPWSMPPYQGIGSYMGPAYGLTNYSAKPLAFTQCPQWDQIYTQSSMQYLSYEDFSLAPMLENQLTSSQVQPQSTGGTYDFITTTGEPQAPDSRRRHGRTTSSRTGRSSATSTHSRRHDQRPRA